MDEKFTKHLQQYLSSDDPDITEGAELLLRLNRNKFLYTRILHHPEFMRSKLMSELHHHLRIRLDGMTAEKIRKLEIEVVPRAEESLSAGTAPVEEGQGPAYRGKREDHDLLPEEIQALYERNGEVYRKMKLTFETLKQLNDRPACDRYEHLKLLKELDEEYRHAWDIYDHYDAGAESCGDSGSKNCTVTPKQVSAARKFLSFNHARLALIEDKNKRSEIVEKMQRRIDLLQEANEGFDSAFMEDLIKDGLTFKNT